jgi:hypothetical protein
VVNNQFEIFPRDANNAGSTTGSGQSELAMEYVSSNWLMDARVANTTYSMVVNDTDIVMFDCWVISAYLKLKYWEAKGLDTTAYAKDFVNVWEARIGKNKGGPVLTLAPRARSMLIGVNNIPDGSWDVGNGNTA